MCVLLAPQSEKAKSAAAVLPSPLDGAMQQAAYEAALLGLSPDTRYKSDKQSDEVRHLHFKSNASRSGSSPLYHLHEALHPLSCRPTHITDPSRRRIDIA